MTSDNLKCPACGFDRLETDITCLMCGIDFRIYGSGSAGKPAQPPAGHPVTGISPENRDSGRDQGQAIVGYRLNAGPVCPSCGFERMPNDRICLMCGIDFMIHGNPETAEQDKKTEPVGNASEIGSDLSSDAFVNLTGFEPEDAEDRLIMEFEEKGGVSGFCPNCKGPRYSDDFECRHCGIVFSKISSVKHDQRLEDGEALPDGFTLASFWARVSAGFASIASSSKDLFESVPGFVSVIWGMLKQLFYLCRSAVWAFKKQLVVFFVSLALISFIFLALKHGINAYRVSSQEKKRLALEVELEKKAEHFRSNAFTIRDSILRIMESRGTDAALSEIGKIDIINLRYNPVLLMIKDCLDGEIIRKRLVDIPFDDYQARFDAYGKLCGIFPENESYAELFKMNRLMLAAKDAEKAESLFHKNISDSRLLDEASALAEKAFSLDPSSRYENLVFKIKSARLLVYEGNDNVVMALRDDGFSGQKNRNQRKIRVWLKNTGTVPFMINPEFFSMHCDDGVTYQYNDFSKNLLAEVPPGSVIEGDVFFYTKSRPRLFVFDHAKLGAVARNFP